jgi:Leucine-rich repeat (LRR) protein/uncharacterized protein YjdB
MSSWATDETWISKVTSVTWDSSSLKRITGISWNIKQLYGNLDLSGCTALTRLNCGSNQLTTLNVSGCTALIELLCGDNQLTTVDVSNDTALTSLNFYNNQITALNVSNNTALTSLNLHNNQITTLDVSNNAALMYLDCAINQLTTLNVSNNTALITLNCHTNRFATLDVSNNRALTSFDCSNNQLTTLNISNNTVLISFGCSNNQLTTLDLRNNTALVYWGCADNPLTSITVSWLAPPTLTQYPTPTFSSSQYTSTTLYVPVGSVPAYKAAANVWKEFTTILEIGGTTPPEPTAQYHNDDKAMLRAFLSQGTNFNAEMLNITANDISTWTTDETWVSKVRGITWNNNSPKRIIEIRWDDRQLVGNLDLSGCTALTYLECHYNRLTTLDVSNNRALTFLRCESNQLTTLDVSNNTALTFLWCHSNQLTTLNVRNNTALTILDCSINLLGTLDVSNNTALTSLVCSNNQLITLDVSKHTALTDLHCGDNPLTTLDVSNNTALTYLGCFNNQLTTLDVSNNTALYQLTCPNNQLATLDISNNTALTTLYCDDNPLTNITVGWTTPSANVAGAFYPYYTSTTLYVPVGSIPAYKAANYWKEFTTILEIGSTPAPPAPTPSLTINKTSLTFPAVASTEPVTVTSNVSWVAAVSSGSSWLSVLPSSGVGTQSILVAAEANDGVSSRSGVITLSSLVSGVGSVELSATQVGLVPILDIPVAPLSFEYGGGSRQVSLTSNVAWSAVIPSVDADWLSISPVSGSSDSPLTITVNSNGSTSSRVSSITLSGVGVSGSRVISVSQSGKPYIGLDVSSLEFSDVGGVGELLISSNVSWEVSTDPVVVDWLSLGSESGSNGGVLGLTVSSNVGTSSRSVRVILSGLGGTLRSELLLTQAALPHLGVTPLSISLPSGVISRKLIITSNLAWALDVPADASWLSLSSVSGAGDSELTLTASSNATGVSRGTTLTLRDPSGAVSSSSITITQSSAASIEPSVPELSVSPSRIEIGSTGGVESVVISSNIDWSVFHGSNWLSVSNSSGSDYGLLTISTSANPGSAIRRDTLFVSGAGLRDSVIVSQSGSVIADVLYSYPGGLYFSAVPGSSSVSLTSNIAWSARSNRDWISVTPESGSADATLEVSVSANVGIESRHGEIEIVGRSGVHSIVIEQYGGNATLSPTGLSLNYAEYVLNLGGSIQLSASFTPVGAVSVPLNWVSSDIGVAVVSNGYVAATGLGRTVIRAVSADGLLSAVCEVTVTSSSHTIPIALPSPVSVSCIANELIVRSPYLESISIYSPFSGLLLLSPHPHLPGTSTILLSPFPRGVLIIRGSTGWSRKVLHR